MMRKTNLLSLLKILAVRGGSQILMIVIVIGVLFAANSERQLYSKQALSADTPTIPAQPEPTNTNTREVPPSSTPVPTQIEEPVSKETETLTPTITITYTPSKLTPTLRQLSPTTIVCGPPQGWVQYSVQSGDNLYRISLKFRTTVATLKSANCMGNSTVIVAGEKLWVPNVATSTPIATYTLEAEATKPVEDTPTNTPTNTVEPSLTPTTGITQTKSTP